MRDKSFIAVHRGGPLSIEQHRQLMNWAVACAEHVVPLVDGELDGRLSYALAIAREWAQGKVQTGVAMKASVAAHAAARESENPVATAVARAIGQAVATAHMADHSLGSAWYALKAVRAAGGSVEDERKWQDGALPDGVRELVMGARERRGV